MKIEIGEYEVYSSGTLITNKNEDVVKDKKLLEGHKKLLEAVGKY